MVIGDLDPNETSIYHAVIEFRESYDVEGEAIVQSVMVDLLVIDYILFLLK